MTIGERIKERRLKLGLTLADLSNRANVSRQTIFRYESGEIKNIPSDKIELIAKGLDVSPGYLMGWEDKMLQDPIPGIKNLHSPDAYAIPILGRICCGDGCFTEDSYDGMFVVDKSIRADYCLEARGDSMTEAGIDDGDKVFLRKAAAYEDGKIYGVIVKGEDLASLKKVYHVDHQVMLQPCNTAYRPLLVPEDDVYIVGECVGVYKVFQ